METLKNAHFEACLAEGMTEEEINQDWEVFVADYEAREEEELDCSGPVPCGGCQACLDAQMEFRRIAS